MRPSRTHVDEVLALEPQRLVVRRSRGRPDVARAGDVLAVGVGVLVEALVVDGDLAARASMSSNVAIRLRADDREAPLLVRVEPGEVQVRGEAGREAQEAEHDVLDALAHVGLAARARPRTAPRRRGAAATETSCAPRLHSAFSSARSLPEVQAVAVDVVDVAELAGVGDLLELVDARVVLEQVADHQHACRPRRAASTARSASATDCASGFSTKQCLPASSTRTASVGVGGHRRGERRPRRASGSASRSSRSPVKRVPREARRRARARASSSASQHQRSSRAGSAAKLRARFGPQ